MELSKFKDIHKNSDIYVIASGPSLDYIDSSFFVNKITIGINQIYKKVKTNYLVRKEKDLLNQILKETPNETIHFISRGVCGGNGNINKNFIKKNYSSNENIIIYEHNKNNCTMPNVLPKNGLVVSWSTITTGIHLAAYMGAKNIILVGHDCGTLDNITNTKNYHSESTYKIAHKKGESDYKVWLPKIENQTIKLKNILKKHYGCNVYSLNPFINFGLEGHKYSK